MHMVLLLNNGKDNMTQFVASLGLVLIAQIPLLLKLWLDHKGKTLQLKLELHKRQLEVFQDLVNHLIEAFEELEGVVTIFPDSSLLDEQTKIVGGECYRRALLSNRALADTTRKAELVLPA